MVTKQFDALTLSFLSTRDIEVSQALNNVLDILKLGELWDEFEYVGRDRDYVEIYRYNDISICLCKEGKLHKQGVCVRFSGNGLAFYNNYLIRLGATLQRVFRAWRASSAVDGDFARCTRIDFAIDDIHLNNETPLLTMRKIHNCVNNHEFRSRLRAERPVKQRVMEVTEDFSKKGNKLSGATIYFGKRKSSTFCRFYDKLLESRAHNTPVEDDITSWVRCEFEFKDSRAMAVFNDFCDLSSDDFDEKMSKVFNNYICFIKKDNAVRSRCTVKRWWLQFLGTAERARLTIPKYKPRSFKGNSDFFKNIAPSTYIYIATVGLRYFLDMLVKYGKERVTAKHRQVQRDFIEEFCHNDSKLNDMDADVKSCANLGLDYWLLTNGRDKKEAMRSIQEDYKRFRTVNGLEWRTFKHDNDEWLQGTLSTCMPVVERDEWIEEAFCVC